jgi:CelD/BcsL family acetyltransferase involved in cellulose biosynthesis
LPDSWDALYGSLGRNMRKHIRKFANRLHREGHQEELFIPDKPSQVDFAIDLFIDLHRRRAQAETGRRHADRFATPEREAFLRAVGRRFAERGEFLPCVLLVNGAPVAVQLCFAYRETFFPYYSGYDPSWAHYGVMMNLFRRCIELAIQRGCTRLDLMLGMDQEKLRWGGEPRRVVDLCLASPRLRSRAALALYHARASATAVRASLRGGAPPLAPYEEDGGDTP